MKIGLLMVITAVSLFTGTVVWSTVTPVERNRNDIAKRGLDPLRPVLQTDHSYFFDIKNTAFCTVKAPVNVELDDRFTGIEIIGDTSVFKYLLVHSGQTPTNTDWVSVELMPEVLVANADETGKLLKGTIRYDTLHQYTVAAANITVRLGIGAKKKGDTNQRQMDFQHCKKVTTLTPVKGECLFINLQGIDSIMMEVDLNYLDVKSPYNAKDHHGYIGLKGKAERVHYYLGSTVLDARQLITTETYAPNCSNSSINIHATEIVNARYLSTCELNISGNPKYKRISESE